MIDYKSILGIIAGLIFLIAFLPYLVSTIKGRSQPNRATWWIWAVVSTVLAVSYYYSGARNTIWIPVLSAICCIIVAITSLQYGTGGWKTFDRICIFAALVSLFFWWKFGSPETALWINLLIDFFGALPTIRKAYLEPESEDYLSWILFFLGHTLNLFALQDFSIVILSYPAYLFSINGAIVILLSRSKSFLKSSLKVFRENRKKRY